MLAEVPEILLPLYSPKKSTGLMKNVSQHLPKQQGTKIAWDYSVLPYTFSKLEITEVISARLANICRILLVKAVPAIFFFW